MRRRTLGVKKEPTIMIIPMIDIVFFLLDSSWLARCT